MVIAAALVVILSLSSIQLCFADDKKSDFGIAGTGMMGTAMGECLLKNSYSIVAWNRSPEKTKTLSDAGATTVKNFKDLFKQTDTVIMAVVGDTEMATANNLLNSVGKGLKGKTVIQWTSHDPLAAKAQAEMVEKLGGTWIGGAMVQAAHQVCTPGGIDLLSGATEEKFNELKPALELLAPQKYMGADPGWGALYDIAILMHYFLGYEGHLLALALLEAGGGDAALFEELSLSIYSVMLTGITQMTSNNVKMLDFSTAILIRMNSAVAGYKMHSSYMRKVGVDSRVLDAVIAQYEDMMAANAEVGDMDTSAKAKYLHNKNIDFVPATSAGAGGAEL